MGIDIGVFVQHRGGLAAAVYHAVGVERIVFFGDGHVGLVGVGGQAKHGAQQVFVDGCGQLGESRVRLVFIFDKRVAVGRPSNSTNTAVLK